MFRPYEAGQRNPMGQQTITYRPIGVIHSPFKHIVGTPIQGVFAPEAEGVVEVFEEFAEGLRDVQMFSHLYLLYDFHRSARTSLTVVPFLDEEAHGVFATRAPCRPNRIGLSIVRIRSRQGNTIRVSELDLLDGTPLLDIKPYVPKFDLRSDAGSGWMTGGDFRRVKNGADDRFQP
jgi:tRNA-Thr(GGU) m(6)t(6)A37 methyltransferase TsaA